jgi:hypothetical protein
VAYHFRAPLVRSVNAGLDLPAPVEDDLTPARRAPPAADHRRGTRHPIGSRPVRFTIPSGALRAAGASGEDLARVLRHMVGRRDEDSSHLRFALAALGALGARLDPRVASAEDGPALRDLAVQRGALAAPGEGAARSRPHLGDLLLFDRVAGDDPASLVAVVVSVDSRHVVEFVYLARGVVRRGYLSPAHPRDRRDGDGRALNTFLRHSDGELPRGAPALAGELHAGTIRLDRLLPARARLIAGDHARRRP